MILDYSPLLYLSDGSLLAYKHSYFYILDPVTFEVILKHKVALGWKERYLSYDVVINRTLRLGVRNAVEIQEHKILFTVRNIIYSYDYKENILLKEFELPSNIKTLALTLVRGVPGFQDTVVFGGYLNNPQKNEVFIYRRESAGKWEAAHTFNRGEINHVHSIVADQENMCLWVLTGDFGDAAGIWMIKNEFKEVKKICGGKQEYRGVVAFPSSQGLLYATDTPLECNSIRLLVYDKGTWLSKEVIEINGSCIYGCKWGEDYVFATTVEPSGLSKSPLAILSRTKGPGIKDDYCHLYVGNIKDGFKDIYKARKDRLPYPLCQFGYLRFALGDNNTNSLLVYHNATQQRDGKTLVIRRDVDHI